MKLLTATAITLVALSCAAGAADIDDRTNRLDPAPRYGNPTDVDEYKTHFIGFGFGVQGALEHDALQLNNPFGSGEFRGISSDGFNLGGEIDYLNGYSDGRIGAYCNGAWSNVDTTAEFGPGDVEIFRKEHQFGCGLKGGVVVENTTLLYAKFGYEWQKWSAIEDQVDTNSGWWVVGAGGETMLTDYISADIGVDYLRLQDADDIQGIPIGDIFEDSDGVRGVLTVRYRY